MRDQRSGNVTVRLTAEEHMALRLLAEQEHRPLANLIVKVLRDHIVSATGKPLPSKRCMGVIGVVHKSNSPNRQ